MSSHLVPGLQETSNVTEEMQPSLQSYWLSLNNITALQAGTRLGSAA